MPRPPTVPGRSFVTPRLTLCRTVVTIVHPGVVMVRTTVKTSGYDDGIRRDLEEYFRIKLPGLREISS